MWKSSTFIPREKPLSGDYIPIFLSECPSLFRNEILPLDVALLQVIVTESQIFTEKI
ncbi:hypothetical protein LEP1GSC040_0483 [Leptospira santarosai str. 2000030832]|nr:hypothetical protein LEP1GSC040_0483 [Leptospira santarosai str. 2000030832]